MDKIDTTELAFRGSNPGATKYGNFINYYRFNPTQNRLKLLPSEFWLSFGSGESRLTALDVGCNAGDLTVALHETVTANTGKKCRILGLDIDPVLIERAGEKNTSADVSFLCCDFMDAAERERIIEDFLKMNGVEKFTVTFCFSITMWIHLNHGDGGLRRFLKNVCTVSDFVLLEPQPWKCYKTAVRRMKRSNESFSHFEALEIREVVDDFIERFIIDECGGEKLADTEKTEWGRKLLFFRVNCVT